MSANSPAPETAVAAASASEVLDLNADATVVDTPELASVATTVVETSAAPSESAIELSAPAEVRSDGQAEVHRRQTAETVVETELAVLAGHPAAVPPHEELEDIASHAGDLAGGKSEFDRTTEAQVHMSSGTETSGERRDIAVDRVDVFEDDACRSQATDPTEGVVGRDAVAPDLNTAAEPESTFPRQTEEKTSVQEDASSGDGTRPDDETTAELRNTEDGCVPCQTADGKDHIWNEASVLASRSDNVCAHLQPAAGKDHVGDEASAPASGISSQVSPLTSGDGNNHSGTQAEGSADLLDDHEDVGPVNVKAAGMNDPESCHTSQVNSHHTLGHSSSVTEVSASKASQDQVSPDSKVTSSLSYDDHQSREGFSKGTTVSGTGGDEIEGKLAEEGDKSVLGAINPAASSEESDLAFEDKSSFSTSDLVWGKVKSHPWWPGQIFDPRDASDMALKHQKKDHFLVAYFGDKTFAWCEESKLRPFNECFSQLADQSASDSFIAAVDYALAEVSRRLELAMSCSCIPEEVVDNLKRQKIDNAGIREASFITVPDMTLVATHFQPDKFLHFLKALAQYPGEVIDRLELAIAKAETIGFNRLKCKAESPAPCDHGGAADEEKVVAEISTGKRRKTMENGDGAVSGITVSEKSASPSSSERGDDDFPFEFPEKGKRKRLDALGDLEVKTPSVGKSFKVGECISRVASRLTGSPSIVKCNGESLRRATAGKADQGSPRVFDVSPEDGGRLREGSMAKKFPPSEEMLSQLALAARDPVKGHGFLSTVVPFFTEVRELRDAGEPVECFMKKRGRKKKSETVDIAADVEEDEQGEKIPRKRGRKKKSEFVYDTPDSNPDESGEKIQKKRGRKRWSDLKEEQKTEDLGASTPDYMTDSYWTDRLVCSAGRPKRRGEQPKAKHLQEALPLSKMMEVAHHLRINAVSPAKRDSAALEKQTTFFGEKRLEDSTPTALLLSFNEPGAVPSETNLIRTFSRFGPLVESETEVICAAKSAMVVFKRRADAEAAFSSAGKYRIFGPALISFQLKSPPPSRHNPNDGRDDDLGALDEAKEPAREHPEEPGREGEGREPEAAAHEEPESSVREDESKEGVRGSPVEEAKDSEQ